MTAELLDTMRLPLPIPRENPNLIFGDGEIRLRPQMEVWFCAIAGTYAARHNALMGTGESEQN
jgi:hypothetical protein